MTNLKKNIVLLQLFFALSLVFLSLKSNAQQDSLVLKNGNVIVGELKSLDKGVVTIETGYSKSDFTIEWSGIKEIYLRSMFLITLKDGTRINGKFQSVAGGEKINIIDGEGKQIETTHDDIVYLKGLKLLDFWSRVHASIDMGLSISKANNLKQYSMRSAVSYLADKWLVDLYYDDTRSSQDSIVDTKRTEAGASYITSSQNWYAVGSISTLSNTEQALKLRLTSKAGVENTSFIPTGATSAWVAVA